MNDLPAPAARTPWNNSDRANTALISWLLILLSAGAMLVLNLSARGNRGEQKPDSERPSPQELMIGRYAVGATLLLTGLAPKSQDSGAAALIQPLLRAARTPPQRFRAAIIAAELQGAAAALQVLDTLPPENLPNGLAADQRAARALLAGGDVTDDDRDRLVERHGWFGQLLLARTRPASDPLRARVLADARRTAFTMMAAGVGIILVVGVGLVLGIVGIVLLATGNVRFAPAPRTSRPGVLIEAFAIYLAVMSLSMAYVSLGLPAGRVVQAAGLLGSIGAALWWPVQRGMSWGEFCQAIGFSRGRGVATEILCGIAGYVALLPILAAGAVVTLLLTRQTGTDAAHPIIEALTGPLWVLILIFLLAVVWAPITEELMFRGAFYEHARSVLPWPIAALTVGVIFAAIHPQGWAGIPVLASIGFNLAVLRQWRDSIIAPVAAHAMNNGTALLLATMMLR